MAENAVPRRCWRCSTPAPAGWPVCPVCAAPLQSPLVPAETDLLHPRPPAPPPPPVPPAPPTNRAGAALALVLLALFTLVAVAVAEGDENPFESAQQAAADERDEGDPGRQQTGSEIDPGQDEEQAPPFGYGDDAALDVLWDDCAVGDLPACDQLFFESPANSIYESFGSTCGETEPEPGLFGSCELESGFGEPFTYGDDLYLDQLWDECAGGDLGACDDLYTGSPYESGYEEFGSTCGNVEPAPGLYGLCESDLGAGAEPFTFGDDPALDDLWNRCAGGEMGACDELFLLGPAGSDYETFGATCGGSGRDAPTCVQEYAPPAGEGS